MGYFLVSLCFFGLLGVSLDDRLLSTLCRALNRVLLHCRNQRALPRIITEQQEGEEINDVAVINVPRRVLPSNALHLGTCALRDRRLLLLCRWKNHLGSRGKRRDVTVINDESVSVSRDMRATAVAEVCVHVSVDVRVRHLGCFWRTLIVWWRLISILLKKNCGIFLFVFSLLTSSNNSIPSRSRRTSPIHGRASESHRDRSGLQESCRSVQVWYRLPEDLSCVVPQVPY